MRGRVYRLQMHGDDYSTMMGYEYSCEMIDVRCAAYYRLSN